MHGARALVRPRERGVARRRLGFWRRFAVAVVKPPLLAITRRDWRGMEHIPATGGAILVSNHISHADPFSMAHYVYDAGRWPEFLAKSSLFQVRMLGPFLRAVRQIPVYRGTVDAAKAVEAARAAIEAGNAVIIYPEGTTTREPHHWPMRGKTGAARLALMTGAPVIPIVQWGPEQVFNPLTKKLHIRPRNDITIVAGPPIDLSRWRDAPQTTAVLNEVSDEIMNTLRHMLADIRHEEPPPLYTPATARRAAGSADG